MKQRILIAMMDGFGMEYFRKSDIPVMMKMTAGGFFKEVSGVFPSVTNVNNISIACGAWPSEHGIVANSYFDEKSGSALYMNSGELIRCESIFRRAAKQGYRCALLTCKKKTRELLGNEVSMTVVAEDPSSQDVKRFGAPADIYSSEINHWLWNAARTILREEPDMDLVYVHTTDYPMHAWAPEEAQSRKHLKTIDSILGNILSENRELAVFLTADHAMNSKIRCWDLDKVCKNRGQAVKFVLSPERDYYVKHHRNFTGCAWLWLNDPSQEQAVRQILLSLNGVEAVLDRQEAVSRFHLLAEYIGDLVILGDRDTMFGEMETEYEDLPSTYRAHGSLHEMNLPLIIHNYHEAIPDESFFNFNKDLTAFLFR